MRPLLTLNTPRFSLRGLLALLLAAALAVGLLALVGTEPAEAAFPGSNGKIAFASTRDTGTGVTIPTGDNEIFTMNPNGTGLLQATFNTAFDFWPAWSPDGNKIAFSSNLSGNNNHEIYMMDPNGAQQVPLTNGASSLDWAASWSPDGKQIAFASNRDGDFEIFVMDTNPLTNDTPLKLTNNTAAIDSSPAWAPNGKKIAFASDRGGDDDIIVMNPDGSRQKNRTNNAPSVADWGPAWQPIN